MVTSFLLCKSMLVSTFNIPLMVMRASFSLINALKAHFEIISRVFNHLIVVFKNLIT